MNITIHALGSWFRMTSISKMKTYQIALNYIERPISRTGKIWLARNLSAHSCIL